MNDLDKYLIASETPVVVSRRHWASLLKVGSRCLLAFVAGVLLFAFAGDSQPVDIVALAVMLVALGWFAWAWLLWYLEEFVITDRRVLLISGVLTRKVAIMPLSKVTDLTYERTLTARVLGYGVFVIESAGQRQAFSRIDYLPKPDQLYHSVSELLFGLDSVGYRRGMDDDQPTNRLPGY